MVIRRQRLYYEVREIHMSIADFEVLAFSKGAKSGRIPDFAPWEKANILKSTLRWFGFMLQVTVAVGMKFRLPKSKFR